MLNTLKKWKRAADPLRIELKLPLRGILGAEQVKTSGFRCVIESNRFKSIKWAVAYQTAT